ncbi:hypothetical protein [Erwinia sp.]|uniref:hypothetical protein n=1 Tax=Erwinia citreus TaxID=558 RepID=UPI003C7782E2
MKELNSQEIMQVSGAGCIQDALSGFGSKLGEGLFSLFGLSEMGNGGEIGKTVGTTIGGRVEAVIGKIPLIGGWLGGLLGN